jgi:hypothetical protein
MVYHGRNLAMTKRCLHCVQAREMVVEVMSIRDSRNQKNKETEQDENAQQQRVEMSRRQPIVKVIEFANGEINDIHVLPMGELLFVCITSLLLD